MRGGEAIKRYIVDNDTKMPVVMVLKSKKLRVFMGECATTVRSQSIDDADRSWSGAGLQPTTAHDDRSEEVWTASGRVRPRPTEIAADILEPGRLGCSRRSLGDWSRSRWASLSDTEVDLIAYIVPPTKPS